MRFYWLVGVLAIAAAVLPANAGVVGTAVAGPGLELLQTPVWSQLDEQTYAISLAERVYAVPASVWGDVIADGDPRVWIRKSVENDTTFAWGYYHIDICMPVNFSILDIQDPATWSHLEPAPPVLLENGRWQASVDFQGGAPIPVGGWADFGILVSFVGSVDYCVHQIPVAPEPASLLLLAVGGLFLRRKRS